tara:strand:+ start:667 stop:1596 length:930 start_codon:yes stop_codon:yes gene_type:complete
LRDIFNLYISVVIPTHNRKLLLKRALESLLHQSYQQFECIVHDNFSNDGTDVFVENWVKENKPEFEIRYFRSQNLLPILDNWEKAIEKASNEFIKILWDDDWLSQDALEVFVNTLSLENADGVIASSYIVRKNENIKSYISNTNKRVIKERDVVNSVFEFNNNLPLSPSSSILRKNIVIDAFKAFDYKGFCRNKVIGIDLMINYHGVFNEKKIIRVENYLSYLDASEDSITENTSSIHLGLCYFSALYKMCQDVNYKLSLEQINILEFISNFLIFSKKEGFYLPSRSVSFKGIIYVVKYLIYKLKRKLS